MRESQFDVLIIGTGISGLTAAIKLAEQNYSVGILTREVNAETSNTLYAQGGIIFSPKDDKALVEDINIASANTSNLEAAEALQKLGGKYLKEILIDKVKTPFERDENGNFKFTREAAHSKKRILFKGDFTGKAIQESLLTYIQDPERFPNVSLLSSHTAIDLLTPAHHGVSIRHRYEDDLVIGAYVYNQKNKSVEKILSKFTILATGGIGSLYLHHSNSEGARGDGHAMAKRAGAMLINMEFIQFHPTTFFDSSTHRRFLISEALRGEGGILLNSKGEAFMEKYHRDRELAPRDVVARAIAEETIDTHHECVYLDMTHKEASWIKNRFPTIYKHCLANGIDMTKVPIPVVPAAHYTCGGVKTDLKGRSTLKNLYAVGEVACTGLHGANRLASTSLLEGLIHGYQAAEDIMKNIDTVEIYDKFEIKDWINGEQEVENALIHQDMLTLKQTMWNYVGLTRSNNRLARANAMFRELYDEIQKFYRHAALDDGLIGLRNAVEIAYVVLNSSQRNKESIGCFYRK